MNIRSLHTHFAPLRLLSRPFVLTLVALALLAHLLLVAPLPVAWRGTVALLLLGLPGVLLALVWFEPERDPLLRMFLGLCGGIVLASLLLLALHALPGPLPWWLPLLASDALSVALGGLLLTSDSRRKAEGEDRRSRIEDGRSQPLDPRSSILDPRSSILDPRSSILMGVLVLAAALRLPFLGNAEFDSDESLVMRAVMGVAQGQEDVLLLRRKGPIEVLLPAGPLALTGQINEWVARLPFALAGIGVLLGCYLLARQMLDDEGDAPGSGAQVGLIAATILALDGFMIAFARIVQYQSVVVLLMLGALWCCWRFFRGEIESWRALLAAATMTAVSLLAHYDGLFVLPALAWLVLAGGRRRGWRSRQWLGELAGPLLVGGGLLASFYLPYLMHEQVGRTSNYLLWRLVGQEGSVGSVFNNLAGYYRQATFYNTTFQIHALAAALVAGILGWLVMYCRPRALAGALAALLLLGCAIQVWAPERFALGGGINWAIAAFGLPLAGLALARATPAALRTLVLWFGPPFISMSFLLAIPNTHFYTMDAAAALLIALAVVRLAQWLHTRRMRWPRAALALGAAALLLLSIPYLFLAFVRQAPEYQRTFPTLRSPIYWASYGDSLPGGSFLGFPHRDGWKVAGELYRQGVLQGSYNSNQSARITRWYIRDARPDDDPDYYFAALFEPKVQVPQDYQLFGEIMVDGIRTMEIYSRQPVPQPAQVFTLGDYIAAFDTQDLRVAPAEPPPPVARPLAADWGPALHLRGYELDTAAAGPGGALTLTLQWQARAAAPEDYMLFIHVLDATGKRVGQADVPVGGAGAPTSAWQPGQYMTLVQPVPLQAELPPGTYWVALGVYSPLDFARLPLRAAPPPPSAPSDGGDALLLDPIKL